MSSAQKKKGEKKRETEKMVNRVLVAFNLFSVLFLTSGILMIIYALTGKRVSGAEPTEDNVIEAILYRKCPLDGTYICRFSACSFFLSVRNT